MDLRFNVDDPTFFPLTTCVSGQLFAPLDTDDTIFLDEKLQILYRPYILDHTLYMTRQ